MAVFATCGKNMNVEGRVREIAERVAASYGLEVVDVELHGGGKARMQIGRAHV